MSGLKDRGIPAENIFLDYAGFRTYDSVIRLNKIFGQNKFTVISQDFHNRRAIYIAKRLNLMAIGYDASDVDVLVTFHPDARTFDNLFAVGEALEQAFHRRVDLVTEDSLSPYLGPRIRSEVKYVDLGR